MRAKLPVLAISLASAGALAASLATAVASEAAPTTHVSCRQVLIEVSNNHGVGTSFGPSRCGRPFGAGVAETVGGGAVHGNSVVLSGVFKDFYNLGTYHGTYRLAGSTTSDVFKGTARITGGTGAYGRARGTAKLTCTAKPTSPVSRCVVAVTLTRI